MTPYVVPVFPNLKKNLDWKEYFYELNCLGKGIWKLSNASSIKWGILLFPISFRTRNGTCKVGEAVLKNNEIQLSGWQINSTRS
jgi:hypothetical protein